MTTRLEVQILHKGRGKEEETRIKKRLCREKGGHQGGEGRLNFPLFEGAGKSQGEQ